MVRFGCWAPLAREEGVAGAFQFAVDELRKAEELGFDMALVAERWIGPWLEAWVLSAALAAATKKIELITAVHPGVMSPQVVAKMSASIDMISGGRSAINIVGGWQRHDLEIFGNGGWLADDQARHKQMDEFLRVVKGLWTKEQFSFDGEFYRFPSNSQPISTVSSPHPRIYTVSHADTAQDVVARLGDVWFVNAPPGHRRFEQNLASVSRDVRGMNERSKDSGRCVVCYLNATVLIADRLDVAIQRADTLEMMAKGDRGRSVPGGVQGLGSGLVGPPSLIADRLQRYRDIGIEGFLLRFFPRRNGLDLFSGLVMPRLARH